MLLFPVTSFAANSGTGAALPAAIIPDWTRVAPGGAVGQVSSLTRLGGGFLRINPCVNGNTKASDDPVPYVTHRAGPASVPNTPTK